VAAGVITCSLVLQEELRIVIPSQTLTETCAELEAENQKQADGKPRDTHHIPRNSTKYFEPPLSHHGSAKLPEGGRSLSLVLSAEPQ